MRSSGWRSSWAGRKAALLVLSGMALAALLFSAYPGLAEASINEYSGHNLPGGAWTTGNGVVLPGEFLIGGGANTTSSVCVGPVTHDSGGFHMPYGWRCATEQVEWFFPNINAAAGLYNPNKGTFQTFGAIAYGN